MIKMLLKNIVFALAALILAAGVLIFPPASGATVIGVVYPEACGFYDEALEALKNQLAAGNYGPGEAEIYVQKPAADKMSWINAFRKFVSVDADLIVVFGDDLLEIACRERTKIPVLFGFASDPTRSGCIKSMEKPGGNITGVSGKTPLFTLLEKTKMIKDFQTVGFLALEGDPTSVGIKKEIELFQRDLNYKLVLLPVSTREAAAEVLRNAPSLDLLFFPTCPLGSSQVKELTETASQRRLPFISLQPPKSSAQTLLSLYPNPEGQGKILGKMAVRLLRGGSPSKTPIQAPKKIELEVNLGLAKRLDLKIPMAVLSTATKVIR